MIPRVLKHEILWSTVVQLLGKVLLIGLGLVSMRLVTNALGVEAYGDYGKISEFALFFSVAANLGIFGNTVRKMAETPHDGKLFVNALFLRVTTAFAFFALGFGYALLFLRESGFLWGVLFFMASLFMDYVTSVCDGMLQAKYRMGRATLALVLGRLFSLGAVLFLTNAHLPARAPFFFLAPLAGSLLTAGLSLLFVRQALRFTWKLEPALLKELFLTSLPFGIINIFNNLYFRFLPSAFAAQVLSTAVFGSYNLSLHVASTVSLFSTFLMFSSLPALKQDLKAQRYAHVHHVLKPIKKTLFVTGALLVMGGSFLIPTAVSLVFGKDFIVPQFGFILPLLLLLAAISYFYDLVLITLFALEKEIWFLKQEALALLASLALLSTLVLVQDPRLQMLIILLSAITAETLMVTWGLRKMNQELRRG